MIDKELVKRHFSKSAREYEDIARIQRYVANELVLKIPERDYRSILDVGCGTGLLPHLLSKRFPLAMITGVDIAAGMVEVANNNKSHMNLIFQVGDGESLSFSDASFDLVVSSSSFQWMNVVKAFSEVKRVLLPGGKFVFACFASNTLREIKEVFGAGSVHDLPSSELVISTLAALEFSNIEVVTTAKREYYPNAFDLLKTLKQLGVQNAQKRGVGLGGGRSI
ncbi:MAG: methyltransferase domain-containing protein, partial [Candidatus Margulisiibacteriota bacterium]